MTEKSSTAHFGSGTQAAHSPQRPRLGQPAGIREARRTYMSTTNETTASELLRGTNRRRFLRYLGAAPSLAAFTGAGLLSSRGAFADTGPLDASQRRHQAFAIRRDAAIFQRDAPPTPSISNGDEDMYAN